jgi:1,2-diacylglycerol 3-alpha-glucosyltransferase
MESPSPVQKRLKIAMVIDAYDEGRNGATISTRRFVEMLRKQHEVFIITTGEPAPGKIIMPRFYAPVVRRVMKQMNTPLAIPSNRKLHSVIRGMDLIHIQFPFFLGIRSARIASKLKVPVISTFHIQAEHLAMNAGITSPAFIRYCYKIWMNKIYNRSSMVICPSQFAVDELRQYGLEAPATVISNGLLPMFRPVPVERDPAYADKFIILTVGRNAPEKRQDIIIQAVGKSKHRDRLQLIIAGEGPLRDKLVESGKQLPNPPVFLTLTSEELVNYYNMADLYVHAASVEVECMTVLEGMGCGLPPLIADSPKSAASQFALDDRSLFPYHDLEKLAEKIDYWIDHPLELKEARLKYHAASHGYHIEQSYEKLVNVYMTAETPVQDSVLPA